MWHVFASPFFFFWILLSSSIKHWISGDRKKIANFLFYLILVKTALSAKPKIEICCVLQVRSKGEQMDAGGLNEYQETGSGCGCSGRLPVRCGRLWWDVTVKYRCAAVFPSSERRRIWVGLLCDVWEKRALDRLCETQVKWGQEVCSIFFFYCNYTILILYINISTHP